MSKTVIAMTGKARSGKDTTVKLLQDILLEDYPGEPSYSKSFARPVYRLVAELVNKPVDLLQLDHIKDTPNWYTITQESLENMHTVYKEYGLDAIEDFAFIYGEFFEKYLRPMGNFCVFNKDVWEFSMFVAPRVLLQLIGTEFGRNMLDKNVWIDTLINDINSIEDGFVFVTDARFDDEAEALLSRLPNVAILEVVTPDNETKIATGGHVSENGINKKYISMQIINYKKGFESYKKTLQVVMDAIIAQDL